RGDVLASAVAGGDRQGQPGIAQGEGFGRLHARADIGREARAVADEADFHPAPVQLLDLAVERGQEQLHQCADLFLGPAPVLAGEREQGQRADALFEAEVDADIDRARAGAMPQRPRPPPLRGPAAVAVHDDCDMAGHVAGIGDWGSVIGNSGIPGFGISQWHGLLRAWFVAESRIPSRFPAPAQTAISSCSLALTTSSTSLIALSVTFWISSSKRCSSSSEICFSLSSSLACWIASRRMLRIATLASSPSPCTT